MAKSYVFAIEGLEQLTDLDNLDPRIEEAAKIAINSTLEFARRLSAREMRQQVRFPSHYLEGESSQLKVTQRATATRFEGVITGRTRATSLARFVRSNGKAGVTVEVKPGKTITLGRAFLVGLRKGQSGILGNKGLAVRTKSGEKPAYAYKPKKLSENVWLLYGPSVSQVFQTVREDVEPEVKNYLSNEFQRQLELRMK